MNKKRILLGVVIFSVISLMVVSALVYLNSRSFNVIKEKEFSFKYPKDLEIRIDDASEYGGYITYQIRTKFKHELPPNDSAILIKMPTKNMERTEGDLFVLEDILKAENIQNYITPLKEIEINGNKGVMAKYRLDREYVGDFPTHSVFSTIQLVSKYNNAFIRLEYQEKDTDPDSLDEAWKTILKTLKY